MYLQIFNFSVNNWDERVLEELSLLKIKDSIKELTAFKITKIAEENAFKKKQKKVERKQRSVKKPFFYECLANLEAEPHEVIDVNERLKDDE